MSSRAWVMMVSTPPRSWKGRSHLGECATETIAGGYELHRMLAVCDIANDDEAVGRGAFHQAGIADVAPAGVERQGPSLAVVVDRCGCRVYQITNDASTVDRFPAFVKVINGAKKRLKGRLPRIAL
jgi:hypothetical protein